MINILLALFAVVVLLAGIRAVIRGEVRTKRSTIRRADYPLLFWITLLMYLFFVLIVIVCMSDLFPLLMKWSV